MERELITPKGHAAVQRDFDKLEKWADMNLMEFRERKCKVLNQERNNSKHLHMLEFTQLKSSFEEKDLGVLVVMMVNTSNVALQGHTNTILGSLERVLTEGLGRDLLYQLLFRPHLRYHVQFWAHWRQPSTRP